MNSDDVFQLHREGWSVRRIAKRSGWSRMKVHRLLTRDNPPDSPIELGGDDYDPIAPFVFVGMEEPDGPGKGQLERFLDGNGVSCTLLDIYRWRQYQTYEHDNAAGAERVGDDVEAQIAAAGWVSAKDPDRPGYWHWVRA